MFQQTEPSLLETKDQQSTGNHHEYAAAQSGISQGPGHLPVRYPGIHNDSHPDPEGTGR